jgi:hypothetical protein
MKVTIEVECTPQEARAFMGLPDVTPLNDQLVDELKKRMSENMLKLQPEEMMKAWMGFGGQAQEQFRKLMTAAATAGLAGTGAGREER